MIRDHIDLLDLRTICAANVKDNRGTSSHSEFQSYSTIGIVVGTKPLHWHKRKQNNLSVECFEFFVSDCTAAWFRFKMWGSLAMFFASKIRLHHIVLVDRFVCFKSTGNDVSGVFSDYQTSMHTIYDEFGGCLIDFIRYTRIITRACEMLPLQASLR